MTARFTRLQDLNGLLTAYAQHLAPHAVSPKAREALRHVYDLQSRTAHELHAMLVTGDLDIAPSASARATEPLLSPFQEAIDESRDIGADIGEVLANPVFTEHFDRLYTILGPNKGFPNDRKLDVTKATGSSR